MKTKSDKIQCEQDLSSSRAENSKQVSQVDYQTGTVKCLMAN